MQKRPALTTVVLTAAALLAGCASSTDSGSKLISFPGAYKIDIQQGNVINQEMVNKLRPGMNRNQVQFVMGTPLMEDALNQNRWDFVYSNQPGGKKRTQQTLTILFKDDKLTSIEGDFRPASEQQ